jgi:putative membrane protein
MRGKLPMILGLLALAALVVSAVHPHDYPTWALEVFPVFIAAPLLLWTRRSFPLTPLLYVLIFVHAVILMAGGHYTYAEVPLGRWMQEAFGFHRNHYDRIGHFFQGFEPAVLAREILVRKAVVKRGAWLTLFVLSLCLAFSACYEFLEWGVAVAAGAASDAFLGTQGDPWDTQWDMFFCLVGAVSALALLSRLHDHQLAVLAVSADA